MTTYGQMFGRIEDEILRTDINANVRQAVLSAIRHYEDERFWFLEGNNGSGVNTVANQTTYTVSNEWIEVDSYTVEVASNEYQLIPRTLDWFKEVNTNAQTVVGIPTDYAFHADTFLHYPTPNGVYPVRIFGLQRLIPQSQTTLSDTASSDAWTTHGEELIRNRALANIYATKLRNPAIAANYGGPHPLTGEPMGWEGAAYKKLKKRTNQKIATNTLQPTEW